MGQTGSKAKVDIGPIGAPEEGIVGRFAEDGGGRSIFFLSEGGGGGDYEQQATAETPEFPHFWKSIPSDGGGEVFIIRESCERRIERANQ